MFQRCATWWKEPDAGSDLSLLLNRATTAVVGIHRIEALQKQCFVEFDLFSDQMNNLEDRIVFQSSSIISIQSEISPILSALRIIQDQINEMIRKKTGLSLPGSISGTIKKIDRYKMPDDLKDLYINYWEKSGRRIRDYRVLDQHYGSVLSHIFLVLKPSRKVLVAFPDNPEAISKSKLTYEKEICGISEIRVGFDELHDFVESIAEYFGYAPSTLSASIGLDQLGDLRPFRKRTLGLLFEDTVQQKADGSLCLNITAIRMDQKDDGKLEIQKMLVKEEKLKEMKRNDNQTGDGNSE